PPLTHDARLALQMALFAHRLAQRGSEELRIDDGVVDALGIPAGVFLVQISGAVAALAADGVAAEDRLLVAIDGALHRLGLVAVTEQARRLYPAIEVLRRREARRQVTALALREPAHRRLKQIAVVVHQVGATARSGAEDVGGLGL